MLKYIAHRFLIEEFSTSLATKQHLTKAS